MTEGPNPATLAPTALIDGDHPAVVAFARRHAVGDGERARAVALTYAVRDGFRYDPYRIDLSTAGMRASRVLDIGVGWCVTKAALLCAAARASGIPARLGYADVRNHLSTERMRQTMKTDLFVWHGYTELWIEGRWVKATPAFNIELCERFGLLPLDFDGEHDSLYHPFDKSGQRHMEYVREHGNFDDMPLARIVADFRLHYPGMWRGGDDREGDGQSDGQSDDQGDLARADFEADVALETTSPSTAASTAEAPSMARAPGPIGRA
jgi:transglutaminase-like putative cysteine protease